MELHQLRYFCAVAETSSFTRGARRERVAQPSLSQQIKKLEEELGAKLFDRLGRKTQLTDSGKALLPLAKSILNQIAEAKSEIQGAKGLEGESVIAGALPTIAPYVLPAVVADFQRKYPLVQLTVVEELPLQLLGALRNAAVDLALFQLPVSGKEFVTEELVREPLYAVVPAKHRLASRKTVDLAEFRKEPVLLPKQCFAFRETVIEVLRRAKVQPDIASEALGLGTIMAMVSSGLGVSVVPKMAIQKRRGCRFIPLRNEWARRTVGLVRLKRRRLSRTQLLFLDSLRRSLGLAPDH